LCPGDYEGFIEVSPATVYQIPVANAGNDDQVCGESYILRAVKSNPSYSGLWSPTDATFADSTSANSAVIAGSYGTHAFTWTETNWLCADDDEVEITFYEMPLLPDAGPDQELDFIYTTSLQAATASAGTGVWSVTAGNGEFSDVNSPTAVVSELNNNTRLKWRVTNGNCPSVADSLVITIKPLVIKKGFTPNGDTKNDEFDFGAINAENISVKIFNSAGVLVYKSDNYLEDEKWKGHNMDGVELPEGTYYYVANIKVAGKKDEVQFRSFVEIMR
jgi:gliding motility-associated-like protein